MSPTNNKCIRCVRTSVWICFFECLFIATFKLLIGLTSGSKAMLGSALYSLTDLFSAFLLLIGFRISRQPADASHPYGHGKLEHVISLMISMVVLGGTVALIIVSALTLYHLDMTALPHWIGIWASVACICLGHIVYRLVKCAAKQANSPALHAHAKHVRLDTISNIAVIIAILAAEIGYEELDPIIAILEGIHVLWECAHLMHKSVSSLMDASIGTERIEAIRSLILDDPSVMDVSEIKARHAGWGVSLDMEIMLDGNQTIGESNEVVRQLKILLKHQVKHLDSVHIHYHPHKHTASAPTPSEA